MEHSVYAKTYYKEGWTTESLEEHVKCLMDNLGILKSLYSEEIERLVDDSKLFWDNLGFCVLFHDCGKLSTHFQNKIRDKLNEGRLRYNTKLNGEIPHNYLSPAFVPEDMSDFKIFFTIAFHHNRNIDFDQNYLKTVINNDLQKVVDANKELFSWLKSYGYTLRSKLWDDYFDYLQDGRYYRCQYQKVRKDKLYILLKGLFHRLDHSSSAHIPVEVERISDPEGELLYYLKNKLEEKGLAFEGLKPFQKEAKRYRDNNVLLTASTGVGKTEFAINWIGNDKAFYTLPLRVSVNAMYERFIKMFSEDKVALLHGDSLLYEIESEIEGKNFKVEDHIFNVQHAKLFSLPITISTADQLFTAVFKWPGYEKIYASLMYSKIVLDEPQSYSPEVLAMIVKCLEELSELGCRFCFMSATIHPYVREHFKEAVKLGPIYHKEDKHRISLVDNSIDGLTHKIEEEFSRDKKILVICNTVKKAQELYSILDTSSKKLLHSGFIKRDRFIKEKDIQADYNKDKAVIWVTTQIVEASLDIDYDILFTELSTIDSLLQRMGRVYRSTERKIKEDDPPNVIIATNKPSDKYYIYDEDVVNITLEVLLEYDNKVLPEKEKLTLMDKVFGDKERIRAFYDRFNKTYHLLDSGFESDNKKEAQKLFRDIANRTVIPNSVYEENKKRINEIVNKLNSKGRLDKERLLSIKGIDDFTVSLATYKVYGKERIELVSKRGIFTADIDYNSETGIEFTKKAKNYAEII